MARGHQEPCRQPAGTPAPAGPPATKHNTRSTSALNPGGAGIMTQPKDPIHRRGAEAPQRSDCPTVGGGQPPAPGSAVHVPGSVSQESLLGHYGHLGEGRTQSSELRGRRGGSGSQRPSHPTWLPPGTGQRTAGLSPHSPPLHRGHRIHFHSVYLLVPTPCTKTTWWFLGTRSINERPSHTTRNSHVRTNRSDSSQETHEKGPKRAHVVGRR